jgi:DNA repair protein RadA/Sms
MLLAVLEKRCGFRLGQKDVFLNITGGLRVDDPALDLAVIAAILSSNADEPISGKVCFAAEVGLTGEVRPVTKVEQRIREAEKLGFERIYVSGHHQIEKSHYDITIVGLKRIEELVRAQF